MKDACERQKYAVVRQKKLDFDAVRPAWIDRYVWGGSYRPEAFAKLALLEGEGFALQMVCREESPKAVWTRYNDPVWRDSCLEFFASFNAESPLYCNLEMNSAGAFLMGLRRSREDKRDAAGIVELPAVKCTKAGGFWRVEYLFSFDVLDALFGRVDYRAGYAFRGNFYKCGDDTETPHFGAWSPVLTEKPDFHRPEYFGELIVV